MEFKNLSVLALFFLTFLGIHASKSGEEYWKSVWPNTPIPKTLLDLLLTDKGTSIPIKSQEEKQYWTIFFEHHLYPGKTMNLGIQKHSDIQSSKSTTHAPVKRASHTFKTLKGLGQTPEKETTKTNQPFGTFVWSDKLTKIETTRANQPFGTFVWCDKTTKIETTTTNQPFGTFVWWNKKETDKENQPFGLSEQGKKETKKSNQPFETQTLDEKEAHVLNSYCGTPSAIGEHKHCVLSLESMMDFAISKLGKNIKVMSSSFSQSQDKYVVQEVNKIGDKAVMCHRLNFEEVVFYCHVVNATTTYMVPLMASDGTISKALTICHHDTRGMNPKVLNEVLNVKPGNVSVCHFIGNKAVAWVPNVSQSRGHPCVI
ncbi:unknown seed protein USP [Lathyrus oleraceus]|uniref:unknown seed protein USP n=1 Tax=Pisum sativum TaxID=3888 RepID=UPI0021CF1F86|nr:unknown seed protein USP-like [Pisum sativum]